MRSRGVPTAGSPATATGQTPAVRPWLPWNGCHGKQCNKTSPVLLSGNPSHKVLHRAMTRVGSHVTISAIVLPVVRRMLSLEDRRPMLSGDGRRFSLFTVVVFLPLQVGTGILLTWHNGVTLSSLAIPATDARWLSPMWASTPALSGPTGWT